MVALAVAFVLVGAACVASVNEDTSPASDLAGGPGERPPSVDRTVHSVPLDNVVFDTFNGSFIRLSDASDEVIDRLRDAIRPIYQPLYDGPEGGDWLAPGDLVIGYEGDAAYAYPVKMLNLHEIVNDVIDGLPLLVTYCPLCGSGVVYDRRLNGQILVFGNTSALFENDLVMYDHQTGSYWYQVGGEAIVGTLTGKRLPLLPSMTMPWGQWKELHPDTHVLSRRQSFDGSYRYDRDPFKDYSRLVDALRFPFPVSTDKLDHRLPASAIVLTVRVKEQEKAYNLVGLGDGVVNDRLADEPVVVFSRSNGPYGAAFSPLVDGRPLTFHLRDGSIRDNETGSRWDMAGRAVAGPLAGQALSPLPSRRAFWFSIALAMPDIPLYQP